MGISELTPIIVGVGQAVSHWNGDAGKTAPSPLSLAVSATQAALKDAGPEGKLLAAIDTIAFVRLFQDSLPFPVPPHQRYENLPASLAEEIGINSTSHMYSYSGGDQPQKLVNEYAEALFNCKTKAVLLCGSEAMGAVKTAKRKQIKLNWARTSDASLDDRGKGEAMLNKYEIANGLGFPIQTHPVFENAYRHRSGLNRKAYLGEVTQLLASFSKVAATNPYSQFPTERTAEFLETESKDNFRLTDTYLKWHVAQDAVNQSASVILTTVATARELGIPEQKWIYLHGYAQADDVSISRRPDLSRSKSIELSVERALTEAETQASEIRNFDIYSCFPCVVFLAAEALGVDWRRQLLTLTGGLPFFGGAGNNYSMHAIVSMVETLRKKPTEKGLILANGGFISKHAVGIYSAMPKENWKPVSSEDLQSIIEDNAIEVSTQLETRAEIESFAISYGKSGPERGMVVVQTLSGRKFARFKKGHSEAMTAFLTHEDPVSLPVSLIEDEGKRWFGEFMGTDSLKHG